MTTSGGDEPDEWEYEYDENETEDFYVVLELPPADAAKPKSRVDELFAPHDPNKASKNLKVNRKAGQKRSRRDVEADEEEDRDDADDQTPTQPAQNADANTDASMGATTLPSIEDLSLTAAIEKTKEAQLDTGALGLQIMDLGSENPMISYQNQLYSCDWASSIGSDLLFVKRPDEVQAGYKPLRSFREVDLLAIGSAKLVASLATIERKAENDTPPDDQHAVTSTPQNGSTAVPSAAYSDDIIRQAKFLGRLVDIKAKRGEAVGNLRSLSESVFKTPDATLQSVAGALAVRGARGRRGMRASASTGRGRGRGGSSQTPMSQRTESGNATGGAEASTPTPATWASSAAAPE